MRDDDDDDDDDEPGGTTRRTCLVVARPRLGYTGLVVELEHLKMETRLIDEKFANAMGEYIFVYSSRANPFVRITDDGHNHIRPRIGRQFFSAKSGRMASILGRMASVKREELSIEYRTH